MKKTGFVSGLVLSFLLSALCGTGASAAKPISAADSGSLASQIVTVIIIVIAAMLLVSAGIVVMIILLVTRSKRRSAQNQIITPPVSDIVPANYTEMIGAEIRKTDPDFSGAKFCDWGKNVFIRMLDSTPWWHYCLRLASSSGMMLTSRGICYCSRLVPTRWEQALKPLACPAR